MEGVSCSLKFRFKLKEGEAKIIREINESTGFFNEEEDETIEELATEHLEKGAEESGYSFVVAEADGKAVGFSCYGHIYGTDSSYNLYWIAVCKSQAGKGIGKKLMKMTEDRIRKDGGMHIYVETASKPQYEPTRQFYIKQDYLEIGRFPDFYADGDAKITYYKTFKKEGEKIIFKKKLA
ncbi:MAG: GNAT family N-acetyltransferase [Firmicutes bacterium]|nr:GNAT family N-acetyltransferase [Bacillota bacterium]